MNITPLLEDPPLMVRSARYWALPPIILLIAPLILIWPQPLAAAPPKAAYLYPAGVAQGQTAAVTVSGSFTAWPVNVWTDRPGLRIEAEKDKGKLKITAAADTPPGIYWLRFHEAEGASVLRPFIVSTLAETLEKEPNDSPDKPQPLSGSSVVNGKLQKNGDVDGYSIQLSKGATLVASMTANEILGSPMDGVMQICNSEGFVLEQNDEGRGYDPLIIFTAPRDGLYLVRTFAFPTKTNSTIGFSGADTYVYRLTITTGGFVDHAFPMALQKGTSREVQLFGWNLPDPASKLTLNAENNNGAADVYSAKLSGGFSIPILDRQNPIALETASREQPQAISAPATLTGRIESPNDIDAFLFTAVKGKKYNLRVESRTLGFPLDPLLKVSDAAGKILSETDDTAKKPDPSATFTAPADGQYRIEVSDIFGNGGFRYVYRLTLEEPKADFELALAAETFILSSAKPLEIPITITRLGGFAGEIEIKAESLPAGITCDMAKSLAKGDSAKKATLKLTASAEAAAFSGPIKIVGAVVVGADASETPLSKAALYPLAAENGKRSDPWLTIVPAKKAPEKKKPTEKK